MSGEDKQRRCFAPSPKEAVMRTLMAAMALALGMLVFAPLSAAAQENADQKATGRFAEALLDLHLTDQQEARIADLRKEFRPKVQEAGKELAGIVKDEVEKVRAVLTPEQRTKVETAREERKEQRAECLAQRFAHLEELDLTDAECARFENIRKEFRPKIEKAVQELTGILTDEQKRTREQARTSGTKRREALEAFKLTGDQKEKLTAVGKNLGTLVREEMEQIRDVLNEAQRAQLGELKDERTEHVRDRMACRIANMKDLNLTDEQKAQIASIRKEFRPKVQEAGNKLRAAVREEVEGMVAVMKG